MNQDDGEFGLVMPFVVTADNGGTYDARSFVAGARMEAVRRRCEAGEVQIESYEPPPLVPQLDLIAMRYGYTMTEEPWDEHPDEWTLVTLVRTAA